MPVRASPRASSRRNAERASAEPVPVSPRASRSAPKASVEDDKEDTIVVGAAENEFHSPQSTATRGTPKSRGAKSTKRRARGRPRKDLPIVDESAQDNNETEVDPRLSGHLSGTTARTSLISAPDLIDFNSERMIEDLPELSDTAEHLIKLLAPPNVSSIALEQLTEDLRSPLTRAGRNLLKYKGSFEKWRKTYTHGAYINVIEAIKGISKSSEVQEGPWRPDDVFFKANLATALADLHLRRLESDNSSLPFEKLDRDFPEPFLNKISNSSEAKLPGNSSLRSETFELALDIRTHLTLFTLREYGSNPQFDNRKILVDIFYENYSLRGWGVPGLLYDDLKLSTARKQDIINRVAQIEEMLSTGERAGDSNGAVDIEALYKRFPLDDFVEKFLQWARARAKEIDDKLELVNGASGLQFSLESKLKHKGAVVIGEDNPVEIPTYLRSSTPVTAAVIPSLETIKHYRRRWSGKGHASKTKQIRNSGYGEILELEGVASEHVPEQKSPPSGQHFMLFEASSSAQDQPVDRVEASSLEHENFLGLSQESETVEIPPTQEERQAMMEMHKQRLAEADKENIPQPSLSSRNLRKGFIDPQANAERVMFDDTQSTLQATSNRMAAATADDDELEEDENDAFEEDRRTHPPSKKRPAPGAPMPQAQKRARFNDSAGALSPRPRSTAVPRAASTDHAIDPQLLPRSSQPSIPSSSAPHASRFMPENDGPTGARRPWTVDETRRLVELIQLYGTSWTRVKREDLASGQHLWRRDQVALKDKARDLRVEYMKLGTRLPRHFGMIRLKEKQWAQLQSMGVIDASYVRYGEDADDDDYGEA